MCKDKKPRLSLESNKQVVNVSCEVLKALMQETADSGWLIQDLWDPKQLEELSRMITGGMIVRVKNEIAVAIAEKNLGIRKFENN